MERQEACAVLTKIATSELIDIPICKELLKARDVVVCEPNEILDVLATDEIRAHYKRILSDDCASLLQTNILNKDIVKALLRIQSIADNCSEYDVICTKPYLPTRCQYCPNYIDNIKRE